MHLYLLVWSFYEVEPRFQGVSRIFFIGGKPKAESGDGVLEEGAATPSPPARGSGEHCELPQRGSERNPDRPKVFHYFQHSGWPLMTP